MFVEIVNVSLHHRRGSRSDDGPIKFFIFCWQCLISPGHGAFVKGRHLIAQSVSGDKSLWGKGVFDDFDAIGADCQ